MSYAELRAFHSVALHGSFTRAAEALHVTQPTLSGQVKALEEAHGVKLLDRRGREVAPTELGRVLLDITRRLFALEAEATQLLAAARGLIRGDLRVAADAPYHVIPLLAAFNRRHPGIRLSLSFGNSERVLQELFARRTDVAVLPNVAADPRLEPLPLRRDRLVVFVERGHPWWRRRSIRLGELAEQRLILREAGSTTRAIIEEAMTRAGIAPAEVLEIGSREAVREAVAAGLGVGVVFESEFGRDDRLHKLAMRDARLSAVEYVVCLKDPGQTRVIRAFLDLVQDNVLAG
jgi:aminoethylphosphonate catabolism LysR family transcriptional regulator